jgi:DHA2 family methylenomycin A resistance protein-like MFS transporter
MHAPGETLPAVTLAVAFLGFFVVTFDAVVVNVALPTIRQDLGGGITGPIDWIGQLTAVLAMGGLTYGAIEVGAWGIGSPLVIASFAVAALGALAFVITQGRVRHPMVPLPLLRTQTVRTSSMIGFAFMVCYFGLPFILSLYFQQVRGLSPLATGALFLPMFLTGFIVTPFSARLAERFGAQRVITVGLLAMTIGLVVMGMVVSASAPIGLVSALMVLVGLGGPLVMPMTTALLLEHVPPAQAGTASGVFNTSRQVGGALAIAVFGALLAHPATFIHREQLALFIAAAVALIAAIASVSLKALPAGARTQSLTKGVVNV